MNFFLKKCPVFRVAFVITLIMASGFTTACSVSTSVSQTQDQIQDQSAPNQTEETVVAGMVNEEAVNHQDFAMGTFIAQRVYGDKGQEAIEEGMIRIRELESLLTFNAPEGDIYNLNLNAGNKAVELHPTTIEVINKAQQVARLSNGAFDITVGPLVKLWGIGTDQARIPSAEEIHNLLPLVNFKDLVMDGNTAYLKSPGQMVDLGGIAKGYAGDEVIAIYKKKGIKSAFINLGGNVVTLGSKPDGSPWNVGIYDPRKEEAAEGHQILASVEVRDKAVVTAGDGERYFIKDGKRYHHILDPHTGYPANPELMSVTLVTDSSLDADALDTGVFILGLEKGLELIRKIDGIEAVFITTDKRIIVTEGLKESFKLLEENSGYTVEFM